MEETEKLRKENENLKVKRGYLDKKIFEFDELKEISTLPSKVQLIARLLGVLNSPVSKFVYVLKNIVANPVLVLKAIEKNKK